ncbi:MAG: polysaccharide deacetylase family protein [Magnetococcales bacterium]|nr:polysaccharide deacetylase family protein [Magnetococcales bacterium]
MPPAPDPPLLLVVVDTEEEFDWNLPVRREAVSVDAMASIAAGQEVCESFGAKPVYVLTHAVVTQEAGIAPLRPFFATGRAVAGAHLHPWNTPPLDEELSPRLSFPGNLPAELERAKLITLTLAIESALGQRPIVYKAGRYGIGPNTHALLTELGYRFDLSPSPPFDLSPEGGPDFSHHGVQPSLAGPDGNLLTLPTTGGYYGLLAGRSAHARFRASRHPLAVALRLPGLLARGGLLNRIRLSPEGATLPEMKRLTRALFARGTRVFSISFHSPTLCPGHTPYVRNQADLRAFLQKLAGYLHFFTTELGGRCTTPLELPSHIGRSSATSSV